MIHTLGLEELWPWSLKPWRFAKTSKMISNRKSLEHKAVITMMSQETSLKNSLWQTENKPLSKPMKLIIRSLRFSWVKLMRSPSKVVATVASAKATNIFQILVWLIQIQKHLIILLRRVKNLSQLHQISRILQKKWIHLKLMLKMLSQNLQMLLIREPMECLEELRDPNQWKISILI